MATLPNVFTPNNDGINDFFNVKVNLPVTYDLVILNRWGNVAFDWKGKLEKGQNNLWNGESKNGDKVSDGVYFYRIEFSQMEWVEKESFWVCTCDWEIITN
ncbi:T9SS type B sorting domain-containing protein [Brumimicrobium oceani]|uniref:T9SS type B sorting domain-containing protein n=1 Tax=Brumimicrobium oceani TaxID=2100725 RepID=UPI001304C701|nr:gliding motility-associated C-terminal domain-containing protein [Brumimicrobium oceani]